MPNKTVMVMMAACLAGCSSESAPPPSCAQAVTHYYAVGCEFVDSTGAMIPEATFVTDCQGVAAQAPAECLSKLDDWNSCMDGVPSSATNAECQVCSTAQMALLECK